MILMQKLSIRILLKYSLFMGMTLKKIGHDQVFLCKNAQKRLGQDRQFFFFFFAYGKNANPALRGQNQKELILNNTKTEVFVAS